VALDKPRVLADQQRAECVLHEVIDGLGRVPIFRSRCGMRGEPELKAQRS
jgi:hypothetical protein